MKPLAIVATHPIQYYVPIYRELSRRHKIELKIFYHEIPDAQKQGVQFGQPFYWDIDLQSGYPFIAGANAIGELCEGISKLRWGAILVHGWHHPFYRMAISRALLHGIPVMVRGDSHLRTPRTLWKQVLKYPLYRVFLSRFRVCLVVGQWNAEYYRYYGVPEERIVFSPHCVDNERFYAQAVKWRSCRSETRKSWGMNEKSFVFLFVGRMTASKRVNDFLNAIGRCKRNNRSVHGVLVGDGHLMSQLQETARQTNLPINFLGFMNQSEIAKAYTAADCLVLPSNAKETWGLVVNEAFVCGLPCLVSDQVGCAVDMIVRGVNGDIYSCANVQALSEKMAAIADGKIRFDPQNPRWMEIVQKHSCQSAVVGIEQGLERLSA